MYELIYFFNFHNYYSNIYNYYYNFRNYYNIHNLFFHLLYYLILGFILCLIILYIYIKVKYRFWSSQPVFHYYNIFYWINPCGILERKTPKINSKFYDFNIEFNHFKNINNEKKMLFHCLINQHFLNNKNIKYIPNHNDLFGYFENNNCYISFKLSPMGGLIGCVTSRNLECFINNKKLNINYVDFLCVKKGKRKKKIAEGLIYTHYIQTRKIENISAVSLFKREGKQNFIVPFVNYKAFMYDIHFKNILYTLEYKNNYINTDTSLEYILINPSNIKILFHFLNIIKSKFNFFIIPNLINIYNQIKNNILIIGIVLKNKIPICLYVFKNAKTFYKNKSSIECIGSYYNSEKILEHYFINGFSNIIKLINKNYDLILIENISYNNIIIDKILKREKKLWSVNMGYYFYNFIHYNVNKNSVFIIN